MSYPIETEKDMRLPIGKNLGRIDISAVRVYVPIENKGLLQCFEKSGGKPTIWIDLENPHPEHKVMNETEVHLGITGNFEIEPLKDSRVKMGRIDIYFNLKQADILFDILKQIRGGANEK